jgi:hypothetical protein
MKQLLPHIKLDKDVGKRLQTNNMCYFLAC